ncbi:MAG: acylphosphatase [Candidatus Micrarchaeaceae archaeon]
MKRFYIVHGFVQGVGYRAFVSGVAKRMGINGFVRNVSNGSVEILAVGTEKQLKDFEKQINVSLGKIEVKNIEKTSEDKLFSEEFMKNYNRFLIEKTVTH